MKICGRWIRQLKPENNGQQPVVSLGSNFHIKTSEECLKLAYFLLRAGEVLEKWEKRES